MSVVSLFPTARANAASAPSIPPRDLTSCIGVVCNGEIEISPELKEKIQKCSYIIGVDGGLNHCNKMNITPNWAVGDFDSVNPAVLEKFQTSAGISSLPRAKDCTDLEAAVEKAKNISAHAQVVIWGGLGGRLDHTLGNIFVLLRNPGRLFLESEQQVLFAVSDALGTVEINHATSRTLAIFPLSDTAKNVSVTNGDSRTFLPLVDKCNPFFFHFNKQCTLNVESGEIIVILDQRDLKPLGDLPEADIRMNYSLQQPLMRVFEYLTHQSLHFKTVKWFSDKESICSIQHGSGKVEFASIRGQTISLIPLFGPATGLETQGLKWDLREDTVNRLDRDFVGTLNVSMGNVYSVAVSVGELVCIINNRLIDEEMVGLKIPNSTRRSDQDWKSDNLNRPAPQNQSKDASSNHTRKWIVVGAGVGIAAIAWFANRYFKTAV